MTNWLEEEQHRQYHEIAQLFPLLQGDDYEQFKADIAKNGLREPIWLHSDGSIIDGRNRHRACIETVTRPMFKIWSGNGSLIDFVVSMNLHRRHLSSSQRAVVAKDVLPILEKEAERQRREKISYYRQTGETVQEIEPSQKSLDRVAKLFNTNRQYVSDAKTLHAEAPDLLEDVRLGTKTIPKAVQDLRKRQRENLPKPPPPTGKYSVIYADPPWSYDNSGFFESAASQYPTMSTDDICALPIKELVINTTVLFLWATNPLLEDALQVLKAWGFEYKTNIAWVKDRGRGRGWFLRSRHELLLIGTKTETPHPEYRPDSCFMADRPPKHSKKPDEAYRLIERMYPTESRIELFARNQRPGWESWGNEVVDASTE